MDKPGASAGAKEKTRAKTAEEKTQGTKEKMTNKERIDRLEDYTPEQAEMVAGLRAEGTSLRVIGRKVGLSLDVVARIVAEQQFAYFNEGEAEESQRELQRELDDIDKRARYLESLTSEQRQELFTRPYPS